MSSQTGNNESIPKKKAWSTWEELLLAFAVKRHGVRDWDSVAMELQSRCAAAPAAQTCREKYDDLRRRFMHTDELARDGAGDTEEAIPWLEELRQLRVAELRQEVHRHDRSIQSLQLKVKKMEEDRERSVLNDVGPDLKENDERSENDKNGDVAGEKTDEGAGREVSGEHSDRENRSFNESNSTENGVKAQSEPAQAVEPKPDLKPKRGGEEDSCNDSSDRQEAMKVRSTECDSAELRDSIGESKEGTKETSDVQSSASLTKKRRRQEEDGGGGNGGEAAVMVAGEARRKRDGSVKSEPLVGLLDFIKSHKHGPLFERRLDSQKTDHYRNMIRQHMDLKTVQARIEDGSYSSCPAKFHLDLLILFNNAIVFFPKSSPESSAAHELRGLVMKELKKSKNPSSDPSPGSSPVKTVPKPVLGRPDSLLGQPKSSAPILVCRKRSSVSAKQAEDKVVVNLKAPVKPAPNDDDDDEEKEGSNAKLKVKEKPVTGIRTMRRNTKGRANHALLPAPENSQRAASGFRQLSSADITGEAKAEKKNEVTSSVKKRGVADFLKRMKKNSPVKEAVVEPPPKGSADNAKGGKKEQKKKVEERRDGPQRRSGGGGSRKPVVDEGSPSKKNVGRPPKKGREAAGKRGREGSGGGEGEDSSKRPKKRTRR